MKIVVFDLDETLGYFTELGILWDCLNNYLNIKKRQKLNQSDFNAILDLFPEFIRPNIINILTYLKNKKKTNCCNKMLIYTNNQGPPEWSRHIISYFEDKLSFKLVDQIIAAFKVYGKRVEICRTSHDKTHKDLLKCTKIPHSTEICFMDDSYYPNMTNENVYYINIKPYFYDLTLDHMLVKLKNSDVCKKFVENEEFEEFKEIMNVEFKRYKYDVVEKNPKEYEVDKVLGKQILIHLHDFFNKTKKNVTRRHSTKKNVTKKNKK
jgi:hypothetical protein